MEETHSFSCLSGAFWGSWFCPGGSEVPVSACPAMGASLSIRATGAGAHCLVPRSPCARKRLFRERGRSLTWDEIFPEQGAEFITYTSSEDAFTFILLHPHWLQEGSTGVFSKQDMVLVWFCFCFSWVLETFRRIPQVCWSTEVCSLWIPWHTPSAIFSRSSLRWTACRANSRGQCRMFHSSLLSKLNSSSSCYTSNSKTSGSKVPVIGLMFLFKEKKRMDTPLTSQLSPELLL